MQFLCSWMACIMHRTARRAHGRGGARAARRTAASEGAVFYVARYRRIGTDAKAGRAGSLAHAWHASQRAPGPWGRPEMLAALLTAAGIAATIAMWATMLPMPLV